MIQISILGSYSLRNRGDEALLFGTVALLEKNFSSDNKTFNLFISKKEEKELYVDRWGIESSISVFQHLLESEGAVGLFRKLLAFARFFYLFILSFISRYLRINLFWTLGPETRKKIKHIEEDDFLVYRSIDQFSDIFGFVVFFKAFLQVMLCINIRKDDKLILFGQTSYITKKNISSYLIKSGLKYLSRKTIFVLRDEFSRKFFESNGIYYHCILPPPSIFLTQPMIKKQKKSTFSVLIIPRVSVTHQSESCGYFSDFIDIVLGSKHIETNFIIMGQSKVNAYADNDYDIIKLIRNRLKKDQEKLVSVQEIDLLNANELIKFMSEFDCIVTERAISVVTGLALAIPTITIDPYDGKNLGLAQMFGFSKFYIPKREATGEKLALYLDEIRRDQCTYNQHLFKKSNELHRELITKTKEILKYAKT